MLQRREVLPLASQKNLLFIEKLYRGSTNNNRSVAIDIIGINETIEIDLDLFKKALFKVYLRHEMLRAVVQINASQPNFLIQPEEQFQEENLPLIILKVETQTAPSLDDLPRTLAELKHQDFFQAPFDLEQGPLWRAVLINYNDTHYQFSMLFNHVIVDETAIGIIFKDLSAYYNAALPNSKELPPEPIPQISTLSFATPDEPSRIQYWEKQLKNLQTFNLQTDYSSQKSFTFSGKRHRFVLNSDLMKPLEKNTAFEGYSLNQILLAALYALLYRYSGESDICLGITSANRRHEKIPEQIMSQLVNCFFNSVPLRLSFTSSMTFKKLLKEVRDTLSGGLKKQLPLDQIWQHAISHEDRAKFQTATPFNILLVLNKQKPTLTLANTTASDPIELDLNHSKFPYFGINLDELQDGSYQCFIEYNSDLFNETTIKRILAHFEQILHYLSDHPYCNISNIPLLLEEEKRLLNQFNETEQTSSIHPILFPEYVHQVALSNQEKTAIVFHHDVSKQTAITYGELDKQSSQLASLLLTITSPHKMIGVSLTRSMHLPIAMIAALKSGCVLIPLEDENSQALHQKIAATKLALIITDNKTTPFFKDHEISIINVEDELVIKQLEQCNQDLPNIHAEDLAYVMFTSGSTNETPTPKAVAVSHGSLANLITALQDQNIKPESKVICTALPTFDAILYDFIVFLVTHGQLHLTNTESRYSPLLLETIIQNFNINFGVFLPSVLCQLNPQLPLEHIISMGSAPHEDTMQHWFDAKPSRRIENGLGHTETGICLSVQQYQLKQPHNLVGRPIQNMKMFILNPIDLSICPIGIPGEIFVSGPGLAEGYLNNPELTQKKFPQLVFNEEKNAFEPPTSDTPASKIIRFYATGDFGCYQQLNDTLSVKFIGRKDRQIKLFGVRLDLNEVEDILRNHPLIKDVLIMPNNEVTALSAYIVPQSSAITFDELRKHIGKFLTKTHLPPITYPSHYFMLTALPLTPNGKIDIKNLPQPQIPKNLTLQPLTPLEQSLLTLWEKVINTQIPSTAINRTFKELGGNSISLANLEIQLNKPQSHLAFTTYIPIGSILSQHMTIASLAHKLKPLRKMVLASNALGPNTYINADGMLIFRSPKPEKAQTPERKPDPPGRDNKMGQF